MDVKTVLITGAGGGGSNNLIRSIRRSAYPVRLVGSNADRFILSRSLAEANYLLPRGDSGAGYIGALNQIVAAEKLDLIVPNNDTEVRGISAGREKLDAPVFLPAHATVELCQDKFSLADHLTAQGLRVARTVAVTDLDRLEETFEQLGPADRLWCRMRKGSGSAGSLPVNKPEQARFWIKYWQEMRGVPENMFLLSEYLPGRDYAFQSVWKDGRLVLAKTAERLVYLFARLMPSGTSSTPQVARLVNNPQVNEICTRAVKLIDPHATGLFSIDLKEDRNGVPCITEINIGRFMMIIIFFSSVGRHNIAEIYLRLALNETVEIPEKDRYSDIGDEELYLIRGVDNEPGVISASELEKKYFSLLKES